MNVENSLNASADLTLNGAISGGTSGMVKSGSGTLLLNGTVTPSVSVSEGTLGGAGVIAGAVAIGAGTTLAPGAGRGTLTTGPLSLDPASNATFELTIGNQTAGGGINDLVVVNGNLTLDGMLYLTEVGGSLDGNETYVLFQYSGSLIDHGLALDPAFLSAHPGALIVADPANLRVLLVVPEPASLLFISGGVGCLMATRWRRRR